MRHTIPVLRGSGFGRTVGILALALTVGACDGVFDVENPNQLVQQDLERAQAANALVNGAEATLARALGYLILPVSVASDELTSIGTFDAGVELDGGFLANPANEYANNAFPYVAEARFQADEAIRLLEGFDHAGQLQQRRDLVRAYLYGGVIHTYIADHFDDFVISNRTETAPPLGPDAMVNLYDRALEDLTTGLTLARELGAADLELTLLAQRARTRHARDLWGKLNPTGTVPAEPLVDEPQALVDALDALALLTEPDWRFELRYGVGTIGNQLGSQVNLRQEFRIDDPYVVPTDDGKSVADIRLEDPVEEEPDPALRVAIERFVAGGEYPALTVVSARELHLIAAEVALANDDEPTAVDHLDDVRALEGRGPVAGRVPTSEVLRHERRVQLFLQGRRLADQYRFGAPDARWLGSSDAWVAPGTFLPITEIERISNCYIVGTCG